MQRIGYVGDWRLEKLQEMVKQHRVCCCLVAKLWLTLLQPPGLQPTRLLWPWDFPGTWVAVSFYRGSFPTQGSNLCLLHWQVDSWPLSHLGSPAQRLAVVKSKKLINGEIQVGVGFWRPGARITWWELNFSKRSWSHREDSVLERKAGRNTSRIPFFYPPIYYLGISLIEPSQKPTDGGAAVLNEQRI